MPPPAAANPVSRTFHHGEWGEGPRTAGRSLRGVVTTYDCSDPDARVEGLAAAARSVRGGRLVVLPTDTVYGLGCDAFNADAVRGLLAAKRRGPDMPVPVLVGSWSTIDGLVLSVPRAARDLIEAFWPEIGRAHV